GGLQRNMIGPVEILIARRPGVMDQDALDRAMHLLVLKPLSDLVGIKYAEVGALAHPCNLAQFCAPATIRAAPRPILSKQERRALFPSMRRRGSDQPIAWSFDEIQEPCNLN